MNDNEESTLLRKGEVCPKCGKDNLALYSDGHSFCFTAGCKYIGREAEEIVGVQSTQHHHTQELISPDAGSWPKTGHKSRGLTLDTLRRIGMFFGEYKGERHKVYPYYDMDGELCQQKVRLPDKSFPVLKLPGAPGLTKCQLFGRHVWGDKYDRTLVITEGEEDMAAVAQETDFKIAVCSLPAGAGTADQCIKANYLWCDRFEEIILWFDDDEAGQEAMRKVAPLFKVGKVKIARHGKFKDASDCLQNDLPGDIKTTIYAAVKYKPKGIVNARDNPEDVMAPKEDSTVFKYHWPWKQLDDWFGYIIPGQQVYHVAGTGVGKTTAIYHIVETLIEQGAKIGFFSFEGTRREIKMGLLTVVEGKRIDLDPLPDEVMVALHTKFFGSGQIEMFDPETAEWNLEALEGYIRYCAKALDCQVIFVDPLSFMVAGMDQQADERRGLDLVGRNLAAMAKELGVHIQISHHLSRPSQGPGHEEGAATSLNHIRGSGGLAAFATIVIGHERNQQAPEGEELLTQLRSLKNRPRSRTGAIMVLEYDPKTGRITPTNKPFPKAGTKGSGKSASEPFGAAASGDY
jgi:twinkle protein